jgi:NAD(P)-dependent dehydrogenase (short-subunit alcohol dehydrogenase family)
MSAEIDRDAESRIALITGANRGIGRATALALARDGVDVIITYRSHAEEADEVIAAIGELDRKAVALQLDTGAVDSFDAFVSTVTGALRHTWGRDSFEYLINNAGMQITASFADATEEEFDRMVDVHLKGVFFLTQKLVPLLADGGSIVNISSGTTRVYTPERIVYGAVKGAIEVFSRYLAQELGPRGIRVNVIAPGATATDFSDGVLRDSTELNRWVTGQRLEVSGGMHL